MPCELSEILRQWRARAPEAVRRCVALPATVAEVLAGLCAPPRELVRLRVVRDRHETGRSGRTGG